MQKVTVDSSDLLAVLKENERKHAENVLDLKQERAHQIIQWMEDSMEAFTVKGVPPKMKEFPRVSDHSVIIFEL